MAIKQLRAPAFEREMRRWANHNVPLIGKKIHAAVAKAIYEGIVQKTPILTGRARGNWSPTVGAPSDFVGENTFSSATVTGQPSTGAEKTRAKAFARTLEGLPLGSAIAYVTNNLDYISKLEDGHSPKAPPSAMVQRTIINTLDGLKVSVVLKGIR